MATNNVSQVMLRQWEMLKILPQSGAGISASEIVLALKDLGFDVSKRTIERDLKALLNVFEIECLTTAKPYGWRWATDASNAVPAISMTDAVSLHMIGHTLKPLLPASMLGILNGRLRAAVRKLDAAGDEGLHGWLNKIAQIPAQMEYLPPQIDQDMLHQLQMAVIQEQQIQVSYQSLKDPAPRQLTLHPLAFILRGSVTYLIARTHNDSDIVRYASHRFQSIELLDQKVNRQNFVLRDYLASGAMQFGDPKPITIEASIDDILYRLLIETPIARQQKITALDNGRYLLKAKLIKSWQLKWWLLSKCEHIEVLKPFSYREEIAAALFKASSTYRLT